jgi:hypothetical protein
MAVSGGSLDLRALPKALLDICRPLLMMM